MRWLFDRQGPLVEAVLGSALNAVWIGPAIYLSRRAAGEQAARRDPEGYALREALRTGTVPEEEATRAALLFILGICLGLIVLALLGADSEGFVVLSGAVAVVSVAVAVLTLTRIRRLASLLRADPAGSPR
ncbi:hypothetical protein [Micromonospora taraxaci]|uniref:hypothetical protein n=1 Tax=Micromonospora taraxaci TaxID=1316803 RepID=UPI0033B4898A